MFIIQLIWPIYVKANLKWVNLDYILVKQINPKITYLLIELCKLI